MENKCIVCDSKKISKTIKISNMPIFCNVLLSTKKKALDAVKGDLDIYFCEHCGHLFNKAFHSDVLEYGESYDNTLHYSPKFQAFAEKLASDLIKKHNLKGKNIIDIGCGKGDFLKLICKMGDNKGVGFDASYQQERTPEKDSKVEFVQDFFTEKYKDTPCDLVSCRHVLEHIETPVEFMKGIIEAVKDNDPVFYFEVPNALYTVKDMGIWDIIYEHVSYFTKESITHLFNSCGLKILSIREDFGGQYLLVEARIDKKKKGLPSKKSNAGLSQLKVLVDKFSEEYYKKKSYWEKFVNNKKKIVIWGAGSKGITFLNILKDKRFIEYIVDLNPHKNGKFVPAVGTKVVTPEYLKDYKPDIVILMNALYKDEVATTLKNLGINAEIVLG